MLAVTKVTGQYQSYGVPSSGGGGGGGGYGGGGQIHKHVFVHVAPEEPPEPRRARPYKPPPEPEKHYKIIFIKVFLPFLYNV